MAIQSFFEDYGNETFNGLDMSELRIDQAYLIISNLRKGNTFLYYTYEDCVNCPSTPRFHDPLPANQITMISTAYQELYKVLSKKVDVLPYNSTENVICEIDHKFGEFGVYELTIEENACTIETLKEPVNIYLPILTVSIICFLILILVGLCKYLIRKKNGRCGDTQEKNETVKKERLKSLDTFRGITIAIMIFVNYGGGKYDFIEHVHWNGIHIADLVFPWFLWIMGVCIPMSIKSTIKAETPTKKALIRIIKRSIILFAIGIFLGTNPDVSTIRIVGVLQRFGVAYFVVASTSFVVMRYLDNSEGEKSNNIKAIFADILKIKVLWMVAIVIITVHTVILYSVPFENCPSGYLGPGGYHENGIYMNCTGGITGYIDRVILGNHRYKHLSIMKIYNSEEFDPEGILGFLPTIVHVIIGVQAGVTLMTFKDHRNRLKRLLGWATVLGIFGGGLCKFSQEEGIIPLNKQLWSISFMLVTCSFAFIVLSLCYILVDITKYWSGKPFLYAGMNAILLYIGHSMVYYNFPIRWDWNENRTHFLRLLENVWATAIWLLISYILYKKKLFLTI